MTSMKNYAKVGKQRGKPAYRTPSGFLARKGLVVRKNKSKRYNTL